MQDQIKVLNVSFLAKETLKKRQIAREGPDEADNVLLRQETHCFCVALKKERPVSAAKF